MTVKLKPNPYHFSLLKPLFDFTSSFFGLLIFSLLFLVITMAIKAGSKGPVFFVQKRVGKKGKTFKIIMFRTMYVGAERDQKEFAHLNEADGPVFKIKDDPRFVGIGRFLARTGLDELPQLINVIKGEMSLVGPRPLPVSEARKLTKAQKIRELVKPGMTSSWVISGAHKVSFKEWMRLDRDYLQHASLKEDLRILFKTVTQIPKLIFS
ncbi:sugar transferase [Patescibacteria group bacterium]|nr:sugar transferase [Patescibacteria group bacterium]